MISKEIKKSLKDNYGWEIVTESPLKILNIYADKMFIVFDD